VAGPRVKPTISTAGDIAYSEARRAEVREKLNQLLEGQQRMAQLEAWREERAQQEWALQWIDDHGGTLSAALKRTHPDQGGTSADFQLTMRAREILSGFQR
jgi:hypothetical protein